MVKPGFKTLLSHVALKLFVAPTLAPQAGRSGKPQILTPARASRACLNGLS